jgi:hypothetical protein
MVGWWFGMPLIVHAIVARHVEGSALTFGAAAMVLSTVCWFRMMREQIISDGNDIIPRDRWSPVNFGYRFAGRDSRGVGFVPSDLLLISYVNSTSGRRSVRMSAAGAERTYAEAAHASAAGRERTDRFGRNDGEKRTFGDRHDERRLRPGLCETRHG